MKKKGFTLIELLAIIVILAIIAVITVPIILNIIDTSKEGAVKDSAYGYKDAVQKFYVTKMVDGQNPESGYKTVSSLTTNGLTVSGETPSEGWVKLDKNRVIDYSLKFGEYVVSYDSTTNSAVAVKNGEIGPSPEIKVYRNINNVLTEIDKSTAQQGDIVKLITDNTTEEFYLLTGDTMAPENTITLLAIYNLNPSTFLQTNNPYISTAVPFSNQRYWENSSTNVDTVYNSQKNKAPNDNDYSVAYYVEGYIGKLQELGFCVTSGRLLTKTEVEGIYYNFRRNERYYWLGTLFGYDNDKIFYKDNSGNNGVAVYSTQGNMGVRPIIYITSLQ